MNECTTWPEWLMPVVNSVRVIGSDDSNLSGAAL